MRFEPHILQNDRMKIIKFMNLKKVENMNECYMMWDDIVPSLGWSEIHDMSTIEYGKIASINSMQFHSDWNWLMQLVEKVEETTGFAVLIQGKSVNIFDRVWGSNTIEGENRMDAVYKAVVQYIEWYNRNKILNHIANSIP